MMIQCSECEHFVRGPEGQVGFKCDPFSTIKEPECLMKWQFLRTSELCQKIDRLVATHEATLAMYRKFQPLQERIFKHMERELREADEGEAWRESLEEDEGLEEEDESQ
jgi:hypothetical protein